MGRITPGCAGMWCDEHVGAWKRIVDFVHAHSGTAFGAQIGHSGRKGSTKLMWEGMDEPLPEGNWPVMAPSPLPYSPRNQVPRAMTREDMDRVRFEFEIGPGRGRGRVRPARAALCARVPAVVVPVARDQHP